jgi:acetoin utilization deacetylase AcuC-like enzyme
MKVGAVYDPVFLEHDTGEHPENRGRLTAILGKLKETGVWAQLEQIAPEPASAGDLSRVHTQKHIDYIHGLSEAGGGRVDADTVVSRLSYDAALCAAGAVKAALESVIKGEWNSGFALVRPPGHHATRDRAMGFCLFNNIAVAAAYALDAFRLNRILILDFDVHHGNGTQDIFGREPLVSYISVHQSPLYPGSGGIHERGSGNMFNIPLPPFSGDAEYARVYDEIVLPLASRFKPEIILVSAGFDGHWRDQLASMSLTIKGYADIMRRIKALAREFCAGRIVMSLEGGYDLEALSGGVRAVFDVLLGNPGSVDPVGPSLAHGKSADISPLLTELKNVFELT